MKIKKGKKLNDTIKKDVKRGPIDMIFFCIVMILLALGLIAVFSASYASAYYIHGNSYFFVKSQFQNALIGLAAMFAIIVFTDYKWLKAFALPILILSFILLVLVLIIGTTRNNATRWLFGFQPSEFTKIATIIFFASSISHNTEKMGKIITGIFPYVGVLMATAVLLILEPHFSATILICAVGMVMVFVGGAPIFPFALMAGVGGTAIAGIIFFTDYAKSRVDMWLHPELDPLGKGYQILQSLYAIGSGGLFGLGMGESRQKFLYIPEPHNDFIFSIWCEEMGFFGGVILLILFAALLWRGLVIAHKCPDKFGALLIVGIISLVALQVLINIAVVTKTIPVTGMPLPFFSYGGTALILLLCEMGLVLNISRYCNK